MMATIEELIDATPQPREENRRVAGFLPYASQSGGHETRAFHKGKFGKMVMQINNYNKAVYRFVSDDGKIDEDMD